MTVVVHINAFSRKIDGGYLMANGKKVGGHMTRAAVLAYLAEHADARCDFLNV